jgi:hypothetical protein
MKKSEVSIQVMPLMRHDLYIERNQISNISHLKQY